MPPKDSLTLFLLFLLILGVSAPVPSPASVTKTGPLRFQPLDPGVHRTYWLTGGPGTTNWNGTTPGPKLNATNGDTITIMLRSPDTIIHSWFLDFNNNYAVDPNEVSTLSPNFSTSVWTNWTFTASLGTIIPHGGVFSYRCAQHSHFMYGTFTFQAGPLASFTHSPATPYQGSPVNFDASPSWWSTNASSISDYTWKFSDGNTASSGTNPQILHVYSTNNTYTVTLNVTDNLSQKAQASGSVKVLKPPAVPFNYQISTSPGTATLVAGQSMIILVNLTLTSGATQNVTLSALVSPIDTIVQLHALNVTSGLPSFWARLPITTSASSLCVPDPCFIQKTYTISVIAVTDTGVDHNATFNLVVGPTPPSTPNYLLYAAIGAGTGANLAVLAIFLFFRSRKKRAAGLATQGGS